MGTQPLFSFVRTATTRRDKGHDRAWVAQLDAAPPSDMQPSACMQNVHLHTKALVQATCELLR